MDEQRVDMFLIQNKKFFPEEKLPFIKSKLLGIDENKFSFVQMTEFKDPTIFLLISIFLGELGVDRFMLGDIGMGVLKLLTGGLCGILWLIDVCTIQKKTKEKNFDNLMQIIM